MLRAERVGRVLGAAGCPVVETVAGTAWPLKRFGAADWLPTCWLCSPWEPVPNCVGLI